MRVIKYDYKQRASDGKWMKFGMIQDHSRSYTHIAENGSRITMVPNIWIIMGVYDYELEFVG